MQCLLLAALFPALFWEHGPQTIPALRKAAIECVHVPAHQAPAWQKAGFCHVPVTSTELAAREKLPVPVVRWEINVATATRAPWVDANGWRFMRLGRRACFYDLPRGAASLAAAEAYAYGVDAWLRIDPQDLEAYGQMLAFLKRNSGSGLPEMVNICVVDDGSAPVGEVLNLLSRQNLLFRAVASPDPRCDLNVRIGSQEYPLAEAADPSAFAEKLRRQLTDEKRLLRIFGSEVVLGRLTGDGSHARLHLLNYGGSKIEGLRIRVLGEYPKAKLAVAGYSSVAPEDFSVGNGATEFTIPEMNTYAVLDLSVSRN